MEDGFDANQRLMLEYLINSEELMVPTIGVMKPEYLEVPLNNTWTFIADYYVKYKKLPNFDIVEASTGIPFGPRSVAPDELAYFKDEIAKFVKQSAIRMAFQKSIDDFEEENFTAIEENFRQAMSVSMEGRFALSYFDDPAHRLLLMQQRLDLISTGIKKLDILIDGLNRGELGLFAAGSAGGKSIMLANIANNIAKTGKNVLVVSLELKEDLISKRLDSIITTVPVKEVFDSIDTVVAELLKVQSSYGTVDITKVPNGSCTNDIRALVLEYEMNYGYLPDAIIIDYIDLMGPNDTRMFNSGRFDLDKTISEEVRDMFVDFNSYGISASQLNRDAVNVKTPTHAHIAGGKSKINTADWVVAMVADDEQIDNEEMTLVQMKSRNTEKQTAPQVVHFNADTLRISDNVTLTRRVAAGAENPLEKLRRQQEEKGPENGSEEPSGTGIEFDGGDDKRGHGKVRDALSTIDRKKK